MSDLLTDVLAAHGGLDRWREVTGLVVRGSLGGPFWASMGWPDVYADTTITLDTRAVDIRFEPYPVAGQWSRFHAMPERLEIVATDGTVLESRERPRESFPTYGPDTEWDAIQTAYFTGTACWNYFTEPFVFTHPGVQAREIEPWHEDGETWRRLAVTFPAELPNHNPDQVFYYDDRLRQRRMDYRPEVTGALAAHYTDAHRSFDGFVFPTRRTVYLRDGAGIANKAFAPITLTIDDVTVLRDGGTEAQDR